MEWPTWAAAVWCEAYLGGSHKHVMTLKFLRAPDPENAQNGAVNMLRADYPHGSNFEAIVSRVPQGIEAGTGETAQQARSEGRKPGPQDAPNA